MAHRPMPAGVMALGCFFALGAVASGLTGLALIFPGGELDQLWRLNPHAHRPLADLGAWGIALMLTVSLACGACSRGLFAGARWGWRIAIGLLAVNLVSDALHAVLTGELATLIGLPIAGGLIAYLMSRRVRAAFGTH